MDSEANESRIANGTVNRQSSNCTIFYELTRHVEEILKHLPTNHFLNGATSSLIVMNICKHIMIGRTR